MPSLLNFSAALPFISIAPSSVIVPPTMMR